MLKTLRNIESTRPLESRNGVGIDDRNKVNDKNNFGDNKISEDEITKKKNYWKTSKFKKTVSLITLDFFTLRARLAFIKLKQYLSKFQSSIILIQNVIFRLK